MLIKLIVVVLLMNWASDQKKALPPALIYGFITFGVDAVLMMTGKATLVGAAMESAFALAGAFIMFWLVTKTGGFIGWLVRILTVLLLGGVAGFLLKMFGGG